MDIIIIGAGISGLSCAIALQESGFRSVRILAREFPPHTTSDVAGGLWFPYKAEPMHRILGWSKCTFQELMRYMRAYPEAGITTTTFFQLFRKPIHGEAWWASAVDDYRKLRDNELPDGFLGGYTAHVPIAEPHMHLPFLLQMIQDRGGRLEQAEVPSLQEVAGAGRIVVNCTGLDAGRLVGDANVFPIRGQIMRVRNPGIRRSLTIEADNEQSEYATYTIARSEDVILGGVAMVNNWSKEIDKSLVKGIVERCTAVEPQLREAEILEHKAGLRPGRTEVRLEREDLLLPSGAVGVIVHNYGHGGSGYTVNWGCAEEVAHLVQEAASTLR